MCAGVFENQNIIGCQVKSEKDAYLCCPKRFLKKNGVLKRAKWFCSDECASQDADLNEMEKMQSETASIK